MLRSPPLARCPVQILLFLLLAGQVHAQGNDRRSSPEGRSQWTVLTGYGVTHTNIGETKTNVETVELIPRYTRYLTDEIGRSWYRWRHAVMIELPLHLVVDPDVSPMVGINFLACFTFTALKQGEPYVFCGGGFIYTEADIPGLGSNYNGNYQGGVGFRLGLGSSYLLNLEWRLHHISNLGTKEPNDPLNSSKFLIGITGFF